MKPILERLSIYHLKILHWSCKVKTYLAWCRCRVGWPLNTQMNAFIQGGPKS